MKLFLAALLLSVSAYCLAELSPTEIAPNLLSSTVVLQDAKHKVFCSGVAVAPDYVLTAAHCVAGGPDIYIRDLTGPVLSTKQVFIDHDTDLMVLHVPEGKLKPATMGDSTKAKVGDQVYLIGAPFEILEFSFAVGRIAFVERSLFDPMDEEPVFGIFFQVNAESRGGNSGGPLFNEYGDLIGILSRGDKAGIAFVVPVNELFKDTNDKDKQLPEGLKRWWKTGP